jgi:hypothetical protein
VLVGIGASEFLFNFDEPPPMKKGIYLIVLLLCIILTSCRKEYVCACKDIHTGEKIYGGHFKTGPVFKKNAKASCKQNNEIYKAYLEKCHLE